MSKRRIGLISDIHGNLTGLELVLAALDREHIDEIICLGDVANLGPQPGKVIDLLRARGIPTVLGNADAWLTAETAHLAEAADSAETIGLTACTRNNLDDDQRAWIAGLPLVIRRQIGPTAIVFCHGSPQSIDDVIAAHTSDEVLNRWMPPGQQVVLINGHTHIALHRTHESGHLINPGSVGLPGVGPDDAKLIRNTEVDWIEFAILEIDGNQMLVDFRRIEVDVARLIEDARLSEMPYLDWWITRWKQK